MIIIKENRTRGIKTKSFLLSVVATIVENINNKTSQLFKKIDLISDFTVTNQKNAIKLSE